MKRGLLAGVGVTLVVGAVATVLVRASAHRAARAAHVARGETQLLVSNPAAAPVALFRAGRTLAEARPVTPDQGETWLAKANHFVEARYGRFRLLYPVPLEGLEYGSDAGDSFAVTVRAPAFDFPPPTDERWSRFVFVPGGPFAIGDRKNPGESHYVWATGFFLGAFEVTNGEFRRFLRDPQGFEDRGNWTGAGWQWKTAGRSQATAWLAPSDPEYRRFGQDDLPVVLVTWHEASAFGRWLTRRLGQGRWLYRLPTEAEWEKAARGPDTFDYGLGMALSEPEAALYNWRKNPGADVTLVGLAETEARFEPNRYGVYHASGNAAEWTQSVSRPFSRERPYRDDDRNDDTTPGPRVTRGGSWYSATTSRLLLAYREEFQPELASNDLGLRIAVLPLPGGPSRGR